MKSWNFFSFVCLILGSLFLAFWGGCSTPQKRALCRWGLAEVEAGSPVRPTRPSEWLQLIVKSGVDQEVTEECSGKSIALPDSSSTCQETFQKLIEESEVGAGIKKNVKLSEESVHVQFLPRSGGKKLVWVVTHEYENGDGLGPVALVDRTETEKSKEVLINVRVMGILRARQENIRLQLKEFEVPFTRSKEVKTRAEYYRRGDETIDGRKARRLRKLDEESIRCDEENKDKCWYKRQILIAEGDTCEDPDNQTTCHRAAAFMIRLRDRFIQSELRYDSQRRSESECNEEDNQPEEEGTSCFPCLGYAVLLFTQDSHRDLPGGWRREFKLNSSYQFKKGTVLVHEQVVAIDKDMQNKGVPPRPYRTAESEARWTPHWDGLDTYFTTTSEPLWGLMLEENAEMNVRSEEEK